MQKSGDLDEKENHIGYYLISKGQEKLYKDLGIKKHTREDISYLNFEKRNEDASDKTCKEKQCSSKNANDTKIKLYIYGISFVSIAISFLFGVLTYNFSKNITISIIETLIIFIPITEVIIKLIQNILGKIIKPTLIPKMDFSTRNR